MNNLEENRFVISSAGSMEIFGKTFAEKIKLGTVICLQGDLGSGKTTFAKGFAKGLGIKEHVTSPTFKIVSEYNIESGILFHIDCYRLGSYMEFIELDAERFLYSDNGITLIEWPENIYEIIPKDVIYINFNLGENENCRNLTVKGISV